MDSDYGIQSVLSDDDHDGWDEIDAPFLERPSSSALVMPAISANGSMVSSRIFSSKGDGFLNGDFPVPTFAQMWEKSCLCTGGVCGCDRMQTQVERHFGDTKSPYVVVFEGESEDQRLAKVKLLRERGLQEKVTMFMDAKFPLSKDVIEKATFEGLTVTVLGDEQPKLENKASKVFKYLIPVCVVLFFLFNPQQPSPVSLSPSLPLQPTSAFNYEIPDSMLFPTSHYLDKPVTQIHVHTSHSNDIVETYAASIINFVSESFQRLWNGLKNLPILLSRLLGLDRDVFETNSERTLRKIELDMDLLVELLDEILEEQTVDTLHDAMYVWNKMGSDIAEPLKTLKYDEKTSSANFLTIIKLEKRLKVVGQKLAEAKEVLRAEAEEAREKARAEQREREREAREKEAREKSRERTKSRETVKPRRKARKAQDPYADTKEDRDGHERRQKRKEVQKEVKAKKMRRSQGR